MLLQSGYQDSNHRCTWLLKPPAKGQKKLHLNPGHKEHIRINGEWLMRQQMAKQWRINLGTGLLPDEWYPDPDLRMAIRSLLRDQRLSISNYGDSQGYAPLRVRIAEMLMGLKVGTTADQICLTIGASHGLELVMRALVRPGDYVLVDEPGYYNLYSALTGYGVHAIGVPRMDTGPCLETLRKLLNDYKPKAFFTQSIFHNPTGGCTDPATAHEILSLAKNHDIYVVEDDVYGDFDDLYRTRIASLDQLNRVVLIGSFSKSVSASIRIGYVAANIDITNKINTIKLNGVIGCPSFSEMAVYAFLTSGNYRKHITRMRERLFIVREVARNKLSELGFTDISSPGGGFFVCARHPKIDSASHFSEKAAAANILLAPGDVFLLNGKTADWFRFNVGHLMKPNGTECLQAFIREYLKC
ncbi:PLP-dependent aminotransferase family protein [Aquitalea magnusonii]|nr:PLP-dependent aminotransferase family protein [Aquitalea magnusonii]